MTPSFVEKKELETVKKDIEIIHNRQERYEEKIDELREKIMQRDVVIGKLEVLVERSTQAWERMNDTMKEFTATTINLKNSLEGMEERLKSNTDAILGIRNSYHLLEDRLESIDDKGKIDVTTIFKDIVQDFLKSLFGKVIMGIVTLILGFEAYNKYILPYLNK